ncbi:MAG: vWA domain-containing protein [Planctomycetota bacterium]|jgi:Mg-chelatase subunit ChlD
MSIAPVACTGLLLGLLIAAGTLPSIGVAEEPPPGVVVEPSLKPLEAWLHHADPILRAIAAFELRRQAGEGAVFLALGVLQEERDATVIGCTVGSLRGRPRIDLVAEGGATLPGILLRLVEHPHPLVRDRAWEVLRTLPAEDPGRGVDAWRRWWLASRAALTGEQAELLAARRQSAAGSPAPAAGEGQTVQGGSPSDLYDHVERLRRDGLELCIVMDHTGSMAPVIGAARGRAASLVRRLAYLIPRFRAGLVTYDDSARLRIALTTDAEALEKAFSKVGAGGGADWEEGVDKGIALALRQEQLAWSQHAHRVIVVIGDAPPHGYDVPGLIRRIATARQDELFTHPVIVHTVSTNSAGVDHFGAIAGAGGGLHVTLGNVGRLEEELVSLSFGAAFQDRVKPWLEEVEHLRRNAPKPGR